MRRIAFLAFLIVVIPLAWAAPASGADGVTPPDGAPAKASADPAADATAVLQQELDKLKQEVAALEQRLKAREQQAQQPAQPAPPASEVAASLKDLDQRVSATERGQALDRLRFTGDYRFESHSILGTVPAHYDGMQLQNLVVKTMFAMPILGRPPAGVTEINNTVASHYSDYQQFTNNLTFDKLKQGMASFPAAMQQQLFGMLMPSTFVPSYKDNNAGLFTNRLRLNFDARVADNVTFSGRLSMYKVFGDSTGVQVFNGQPNSLNVGRHHQRRSQFRPGAGRARLFQLEQHRRFEALPLDRAPAFHRGPAHELPPGRAARRHPLGRADRLPVRRHHRRLPARPTT